jgi:hypothetical protein
VRERDRERERERERERCYDMRKGATTQAFAGGSSAGIDLERCSPDVHESVQGGLLSQHARKDRESGLAAHRCACLADGQRRERTWRIDSACLYELLLDSKARGNSAT